MDINCTYLPGCGPAQIININIAVNSVESLIVYNQKSCSYGNDTMQYAYSVDGVCWSCYMSWQEFQQNTISLNTDFYVRVKVKGDIGGITINGATINDYSTQLAGCFEFSYSSVANASANQYNPYANMDAAIALQQQLNESVAAISGILIYYFKLSPEAGSKDITFKEYTLMNVESVKQLKMIIGDGTLPSSRPEFAEWGLDWQSDWECEITKGQFATAFGMTAQPMEGDLIYIPMMKRMWMVNGAWEEKNGNLMWQGTTFTVSLVKYQEKGSVDLGFSEEMINTFVKNKYEDLFGEDDMNTLDSGTNGVDAPTYAGSQLYSVYESDATRKYVTCDTVDIRNNTKLWYKGTMISDSQYHFITPTIQSSIIYQKTYCGDEYTISFIINPMMLSNGEKYNANLFTVGNLKITIQQNGVDCIVGLNKNKKCELKLTANTTYFVIFRFSKNMNIFDARAYKYVYNTMVPKYKLQNVHYWFDIDDETIKYVGKYDDEYTITEKSQITVHGFYGSVTNIKMFDVYNDDISEILQMYPTNQHLLINDTARKIIDGTGVALP